MGADGRLFAMLVTKTKAAERQADRFQAQCVKENLDFYVKMYRCGRHLSDAV